MRKWVILSALLLLAGVSTAQDEQGTTAYIGTLYDSDAGLSLMLGGATPVVGKLYALAHIDPSRYGEVETDLAYFILDKPGSEWYIALVAGPNADWVDEKGKDAITYLVGTAGLLVGYKPVGVGCSYKFSYKEDDLYQDGWRAAAWVSFSFTAP